MSHDNCEHHVLGATQSGSKANENPKDFAKQYINSIDQFIVEHEYVQSPARLALIPVPKTFQGIDCLHTKNVKVYYETMPSDLAIGERRIINDELYWELRMFAEIPIIVDKSLTPKVATMIAVILGPQNVIWTAYPIADQSGIAPQITKTFQWFWESHIFCE